MITLTREEAHQLLVALQELNKLSIGENAICLPAEIDDAMEVLEAQLSQCEQCGEVNPAEIHTCTPMHWSDCAVHSEPAYPAGECDCGGVQPEPEHRDVVIKGDLWRIEFLPDHAASVVLVKANYEDNLKQKNA
jgi:hypothetical protein